MSLDTSLNIYRAIGEETRLRIMVLLVRGELTVSELTNILGQSQPRVSRHLKILADAGLIERHREGAWMFYRIAGNAREANSAGRSAVLQSVDALIDSGDRIISRDSERFSQSRQARAALAAEYFQRNAADWNAIRRLHLPESDIEAHMREMLGDTPVQHFIDLGTGAGRMLEIFADFYEDAIGYDLSHEMLAIARANLEKTEITNAQVRFADLFSLPSDAACADLVCFHHVLHFLVDPGGAISEATRLLTPGGRLIISDFAPHDLEFLREEHAHRRLGFSNAEIDDWCTECGLNFVNAKTLSPASNEKKKLTVKIWLYEAPRDIHKFSNQPTTSNIKTKKRKKP